MTITHRIDDARPARTLCGLTIPNEQQRLAIETAEQDGVTLVDRNVDCGRCRKSIEARLDAHYGPAESMESWQARHDAWLAKPGSATDGDDDPFARC